MSKIILKLFICFETVSILLIQIESKLRITNAETSGTCLSFVTQNDCKKNEYLTKENSASCPICRKGLPALTIGCDNNDMRKLCAPGLLCVNSMCIFDKQKCSYTYHLSRDIYRPKCESDESFSSVQCKGDKILGRCFCYNKSGQRIFGWDWRSNNAESNMKCECSRMKDVDEYSTFHCKPNGNFESLQCTDGICWCANEKTGHVLPDTRAVPEHLWTYLPCYDLNEMSTRYLRQCESMTFAQNTIRKMYKQAGTEVTFNPVKCDYDGNYGPYTIENGIAACTWRDGSRISPYQSDLSTVQSMNCACARDIKIFTENGLNFPLKCSGNGDYEPLQIVNGKKFCVDNDGFTVSGYLNSNEFDCNKYFYYTAKPKTIFF